MEPVNCLECGFPLGMYYEAFLYLKNKKLKESGVHIEKRIIDPNIKDNLVDVFEKLRIEKYCCRSQLLTSRNMNEIDI